MESAEGDGMTIYKDVNGREFTYNEYWNKIYLDEKRPHVDHIIRHKWPEEKPKESNSYLIMNHGGAFHTFHYFLEIEELEETEKLEEGWYAYPGYNLNEVVKYWWNLPEVRE